MSNMNKTGIFLAALVVIIVGLFIVFPILLVFLGTIILFLFVAWVVGYPITITKNDKKIGHIRWFKFHRD